VGPGRMTGGILTRAGISLANDRFGGDRQTAIGQEQSLRIPNVPSECGRSIRLILEIAEKRYEVPIGAQHLHSVHS
jgi:hypothetical protein